MAHREDLDAALARAEALEAEVGTLERRIAEENAAELREQLASVSKERDALATQVRALRGEREKNKKTTMPAAAKSSARTNIVILATTGLGAVLASFMLMARSPAPSPPVVAAPRPPSRPTWPPSLDAPFGYPYRLSPCNRGLSYAVRCAPRGDVCDLAWALAREGKPPRLLATAADTAPPSLLAPTHGYLASACGTDRVVLIIGRFASAWSFDGELLWKRRLPVPLSYTKATVAAKGVILSGLRLYQSEGRAHVPVDVNHKRVMLDLATGEASGPVDSW
jgi:hypothetical protein